MSALWFLTVLSIWVSASILLVAIFTDEYDDTLCQRIGMAAMIITLIGRASTIWDTQFVAPNQVVFFWAFCAFTVSTAIRVVFKRRGIETSGCWPFAAFKRAQQ